MLNLHAIQRQCPGASGLKSISLVNPDDLEVQPRWYHIPVVQALQFKAGRAAFDISHRLITGIISDKTDLNSSGDTYTYTVGAQLDMVSIEMEFLRAKLRNRKVHVLCTDLHDKQRIVPYMRLIADGTTGNNSTRAGYSIQGRRVLSSPAPFLNEVPNIIGPPYIPPTDPGVGGSGTGFTPQEIVTTASDYTYTLATGKFLMAIFIKSTSAQIVSIGYSAGASELGGPIEMVANTKYQFGDNWLYPDIPVNIHISGLQGTNTIEICVL